MAVVMTNPERKQASKAYLTMNTIWQLMLYSIKVSGHVRESNAAVM